MTVLAAIGCGSVAALADESRVPPQDYIKPYYVDSDGCLFTRSVIAGWVIWVQRLDRQKKPICGMVPSVIVPAAKANQKKLDTNT